MLARMTAGPSVSTIEHAVRLAARAPSLHNSQPWQWQIDNDIIRLYGVAERMLPTTDPSGRQLLISCGAALGHLRTAMAAAGWRASIARLPDPGRPALLAAITFDPADSVTEADRARADAIDRRYTDRLPFPPPPDWPEFEPILRDRLDADGSTSTPWPPRTTRPWHTPHN